LEQLNQAEGLGGALDRWGGGDTIGGSPRVKGSALAPAEVEKLINAELARGG
jgi:hypothetical protein